MPPSPTSLPKIITPTLLSYLRSHPSLPPQSWYYISAVALSAINRPDEIGTVFRDAIDRIGGERVGNNRSREEKEDGMVRKGERDEQQMKVARRMREALVKGGVVCGLPKSINALLALKACTPPHLLDPPSIPSPTGRHQELFSTPSSKIIRRGQTFFDTVYGKVSQRVMGQMDNSGTEDLGIMARLMYGYMLSNEAILGAKETSLVVVSGLIPQDVNPQLKGHLKGALNNGATVEEVRAVRECVIRICEEGGMKNLNERTPGGWGWTGEVANL